MPLIIFKEYNFSSAVRALTFFNLTYVQSIYLPCMQRFVEYSNEFSPIEQVGHAPYIRCGAELRTNKKGYPVLFNFDELVEINSID